MKSGRVAANASGPNEDGAGPLDGLNVLDIGTGGVGPWAAVLLGYLGANVIKIESPSGDRLRRQQPLMRGLSTTYTAANLNKRAGVIDLKNERTAEARHQLIRQADVVMDNLRPGVAERLGFGYDEVRKVNSLVVSASCYGWGEKGPLSGLAAFDPHFQMLSGFASVNGALGDVGELARYPHLDFNASCVFAATVLLGVIARDRTALPQRVWCSQLGSTILLLSTRIGEYLATGARPSPMGSACAAAVPSQAFRCADRRYLLVSVEAERHWVGLCRALGQEGLTQDARFATNRARASNREALLPILEAAFASKPSRWWVLRLGKERVPRGYCLTFEQLRYHQQIVDNDLLHEVNVSHQGRLYVGGLPWRFTRTPARIGTAPSPGEHTEEILAHGFGREPAGARAGATPTEASTRPLEGTVVLEASSGNAGPIAGLLLALSGARVIKVEPVGGDPLRGSAPSWFGGDGAAFAMLNHNKESVELSLDDGSDQERYRHIASGADIVIEDWGPGEADRRGLSYRSLSRQKRDLVYCAINWFGESGPVRNDEGAELVLQGWSEYLQTLGFPTAPPERYGADVVGFGTGLMAFLGILAAIYHRNRSGDGQRLSVSALGAMMCLKSAQWAAVSDPDDWQGYGYCQNEVYGKWCGYPAADRPIYFALDDCDDVSYAGLLNDLGMSDALKDSRFVNGPRYVAGVGMHAREVAHVWRASLSRVSASEAARTINRRGGSAVEMHWIDEVLDLPQVAELDLVERAADGRPYLHPPWNGPWRRVRIQPPPCLGEHQPTLT